MSAVVIQADRRAAAPYMGFAYQRAIDGQCDEGTLVQAFARHRTEAQAKLREALHKLYGHAWLNTATNQGHAELAAEVEAILRDTQP